MATSKTRRKSAAKKSPARKSAVPEAPTSAAPDSDASVLTRMRASQPRLSDVEVSAFRSLVSDAECRSRGVLTRAAVRAAAAFEKARASSAETAPTPPDDGALNVLEGRMVLEFGALLDAIHDGREEGLGITALEVGPALRRALLQDAPKPVAKEPAKPDAPTA